MTCMVVLATLTVLPPVPLGLDSFLPIPASNPLTAEKVAIGKQLFFDPRLSRDETVSCATCHRPEMAFADDRPVSVGIGAQAGDRRTPRIANRVYGRSFFWDGRAATLEEQVLQPIENPKEMDLPATVAASRVGLSVTAMQEALASYVRTILSGGSAYDRFAAGDDSALTQVQRAGLRLFRGKAGCSSCHVGPNFTDERLHATGLGNGAFKTPSLRDAARTPPYMHDGSLATLADVINFYDQGGKPHPRLDPEMRRLNLSTEEKRALVEFLSALNGTIRDGL